MRSVFPAFINNLATAYSMFGRINIQDFPRSRPLSWDEEGVWLSASQPRCWWSYINTTTRLQTMQSICTGFTHWIGWTY